MVKLRRAKKMFVYQRSDFIIRMHFYSYFNERRGEDFCVYKMEKKIEKARGTVSEAINFNLRNVHK